MGDNILKKIKESDLRGRGGSFFPVYKKWEHFKSQEESKKYIICNASEGEMDVFKDKYILENHLEEAIKGIEITLSFFKARKAFLYIKKDYYNAFKDSVLTYTKNLPISLKVKEDFYIAGEETAAINSIEGNRAEPKIKPPFPTEKGLWGYPTLVHNIETFYCIFKIWKGKYENDRFFSISGEAKNRGVFKLKQKSSIEEVLKNTGNLPEFDYFLQVGGGASGQVLTKEETDKPIESLGAIKIYS